MLPAEVLHCLVSSDSATCKGPAVLQAHSAVSVGIVLSRSFLKLSVLRALHLLLKKNSSSNYLFLSSVGVLQPIVLVFSLLQNYYI